MSEPFCVEPTALGRVASGPRTPPLPGGVCGPRRSHRAPRGPARSPGSLFTPPRASRLPPHRGCRGRDAERARGAAERGRGGEGRDVSLSVASVSSEAWSLDMWTTAGASVFAPAVYGGAESRWAPLEGVDGTRRGRVRLSNYRTLVYRIRGVVVSADRRLREWEWEWEWPGP
jgi:hypothetical protein